MRLLLIDHRDSYSEILRHALARAAGQLPAVVQHDAAVLAEPPAAVAARLEVDFDAIVLSPGPGAPDAAADVSGGVELLRALTVPVLGVCLGMQMMVVAEGGTVSPMPEPEHGRPALLRHSGGGILSGVPQETSVMRYHSLATASVPQSLRVIATSQPDGMVMALEHRRRPWWGVQFHPESVFTVHGDRMLCTFVEHASAWGQRAA